MTSAAPDHSASGWTVTRDTQEVTSDRSCVTQAAPISSSEAMYSSKPMTCAPTACVYQNSNSYGGCTLSYGAANSAYEQSRYIPPSFLERNANDAFENSVMDNLDSGVRNFVEDHQGKQVQHEGGTSCFFPDCGLEEAFYPSDHWQELGSYFENNSTAGHISYNDQSGKLSVNEYTDRREYGMRQNELGDTEQRQYSFVRNTPSNIFSYPQNCTNLEASDSFSSNLHQFSTFSSGQPSCASASLYGTCESDIQSYNLHASNPFHDDLMQFSQSQWQETDIDGPSKHSSFGAYQNNQRDSSELSEPDTNGTTADTNLITLQKCPGRRVSAIKDEHLQGTERYRQAQEHSSEIENESSTGNVLAENGFKRKLDIGEPDTGLAAWTTKLSDNQPFQQNQSQQKQQAKDQFHIMTPDCQQSQSYNTLDVSSDPRDHTEKDCRNHSVFRKTSLHSCSPREGQQKASIHSCPSGEGQTASQSSPSSCPSSGKSLSRLDGSKAAHPPAPRPDPAPASSPRAVPVEPHSVSSSEKCGGATDVVLHDDSSLSPSSSTTSLIDVDHLLSSGVTVAGFKPRPIIRKRRKVMIPQNSKDADYWRKRKKNNDSAKRSREAKKEKEKNFYRRALELEYENYFLKERLGQLEAQLHAVTGMAATPHEYGVVPASHEYVAVNTPPEALFMS